MIKELAISAAIVVGVFSVPACLAGLATVSLAASLALLAAGVFLMYVWAVYDFRRMS